MGLLWSLQKKILQVCQYETWDCFVLQRSSNLGAMFDKHILRSSSICARLRYFILSAVSFEKPASHKYVDAQRRSIFKAMSQSWGNSGIIATQNDEREEVVNRCLSLLSLFSSKSCSCMTARLIPNPGEWTVVVFEIGPKLILQRWKVISSWFLICMASCCHLPAPRHKKH